MNLNMADSKFENKKELPPLLSCVIVNYKTPHYLIDCLPGLLSELKGIDAIVNIVDNKSGDDSVKIIREWISSNGADREIRIIESPTNSGFAAEARRCANCDSATFRAGVFCL
jgi:GT2 family glycosyltransferase